MSIENFKPTVIPEIPFPQLSQTGGSEKSSGNKDTFSPKEISPTQFPTINIATGLRSSSFDSERRQILSNFTFSQFGAISIGNRIRISQNGIYATNVSGVPTFSLNANTGAILTAGYIQVGGAGGDINGGVTLIAPGKVLISGSTVLSSWSSNSDATYIDGGKIYAHSITAGQIQTNSLTVGTDVNLGTAKDAAGVTTIVNGVITADYINARVAISASQIIAGTLSVGGSGQPEAILLVRDSGGTGTKLRWEGGSRIWADNSNNFGFNAIGGTLVFYSNSSERMQVNSGGINVSGDVTTKNLYLNQGQNEGSIHNVDRIRGYNDLNFVGNGDVRFYRDGSDGAGVRFEWGTGKIFSYSSSINLGGTDKTAIVPSSKGFRALYSAESPEVWFFDFCPSKDDIDPLFLEVTEGDLKFIKCDGGYQVWRKRKGHANKRFELKTALQFYKNEAFLGLAK
ncbi:MAG: hypothetical protein WA019_00685 [Candidatus Moraniibacteriota bacterium]